MLVPLAAPFFALLASAPAVVAQANAASSSLPATADVTLRVTTTLPVAPAQTGEVTNTTPTTDENSRIKFITELEYTSQQDLAMHKVISPNSTVYHVCSVANAIEFDYPIPSPPSDKNPKGTTLGFLVGTPSGNETILSGTLYDIDPGFAGKKIAAVNWTSSGRCVAGSNYYLTIVDKGCLENTTAFVQGCEYHYPFTGLGSA